MTRIERHQRCDGAGQPPIDPFGPGLTRDGGWIRGRCRECEREYDCRFGLIRAHVDYRKPIK